MTNYFRAMLLACLLICASLGIVGCGDEAAPPAGAGNVSVEPSKPTSSKPAQKELTAEDWKRMEEKARADEVAANKKLEATADDVQKNFDRIRQDLEANEKKAADKQAQSTKAALDKFDAATQPNAKASSTGSANQPKP